MRSIMQNVFKEKIDDQLKIPIVINKGQSHYLDKYNKTWLGKRSNENQQNSAGRKRVKFSNL